MKVGYCRGRRYWTVYWTREKAPAGVSNVKHLRLANIAKRTFLIDLNFSSDNLELDSGQCVVNNILEIFSKIRLSKVTFHFNQDSLSITWRLESLNIRTSSLPSLYSCPVQMLTSENFLVLPRPELVPF